MAEDITNVRVLPLLKSASTCTMWSSSAKLDTRASPPRGLPVTSSVPAEIEASAKPMKPRVSEPRVVER